MSSNSISSFPSLTLKIPNFSLANFSKSTLNFFFPFFFFFFQIVVDFGIPLRSIIDLESFFAISIYGITSVLVMSSFLLSSANGSANSSLSRVSSEKSSLYGLKLITGTSSFESS